MTGVEQGERTAEAGESERGRRGLAWLVWVSVVFVVYVLSIGPVLRYCSDPVPAAVAGFYAPLMFSCNHCAPAKAFLNWYIQLWGIK